jgi:ferrochelatase
LAIRGREQFIEAGGERFAYLACLNDSPGGIAMLRSIVGTELEGWVSHQ